MKNQPVIIYTDGASSGNPGPGGWGAVIAFDDQVIELGGGEDKTTNNRMEMKAALESLKYVANLGKEIEIYTDSSYLINGITKWVSGWMNNNWQTKSKQDVLNKDLWQDLYEVTQNQKIKWIAVRGHAGSALNNRVDEIAVSFSKNEKINLYQGDRGSYKFDVKAPTDEELAVKSDNERRKQKAYSYLSLVDGLIERHETWAECEARVKGKTGAKFRKALSADEEALIIKDWKFSL